LRKRDLAKALRLPLGFVLAGLYLWLAPRFVTPVGLAVGSAVALLGLLVRGWASGHIMKNQRLATTGPYAFTRNPLYFGSFLIGVGFAIAAHWSLVLLVIAFWGLIYWPTMLRERGTMMREFPGEYPEYERNVPKFFPRPTPWRRSGVEGGSYSFALYMKHGEWKAALGYLFVVAWLVGALALRR
jgi:protein-S-isoprenylcysteine O-methyltransferase Ste14